MIEEESFMDPFYPKPILNVNSFFQKPIPIRDELLMSEVGERSPETWANPFVRISNRRLHKISRYSRVLLLAQLRKVNQKTVLDPLHGV